MSDSLIERVVRAYGPEAVYAVIPPKDRAQFQYEWRIHARPEQLPPTGDWRVWLILAGRGFGKTRTGAEWVRQYAYDNPGCLIALIARTAADVRTTMLEGPSGLLSISPPWFTPHHEPSKCKLVWPNGSTALHFSAEEPKGLRGPQFHAAWCDEIAAWSAHDAEDEKGAFVKGVPHAWTQLQFGMRLPGSRPRIVATTTPRPVKLIKDLIVDPGTVTTRGSTFDNAANLAPEFITAIKSQYEGTRIGRQELNAEVLLDVPGALWSADMIHSHRVERTPTLLKVTVALDPSGSNHRKSDEAGIVAAGIGFCGCNGNPRDVHGFVLEDASGIMSPDAWGRKTIDVYQRRQADKVVGERNYGGDMVETVVRHADNAVAYEEVVASRGKAVRAAPVAALYEQGKVHHVGYFPELEDEQTTFDPLTSKFSPGRLDALVFALTHLMIGPGVGDPAGISSGDPYRTHTRRVGL